MTASLTRIVSEFHRPGSRGANRRGEYVRGPYKKRDRPPVPDLPQLLAQPHIWASFEAKRDKSGDCWLWLASKDKDGYGKFQVSIPGHNRQLHVRAHVVAFVREHGRVPVGVIRHTCDNPGCTRPLHLLEGTQKQNRADTVARGREPRGSQKPNAIFTEALVAEAKRRAAAGERVCHIARELSVPYHPLWKAIKRWWRHVP